MLRNSAKLRGEGGGRGGGGGGGGKEGGGGPLLPSAVLRIVQIFSILLNVSHKKNFFKISLFVYY